SLVKPRSFHQVFFLVWVFRAIQSVAERGSQGNKLYLFATTRVDILRVRNCYCATNNFLLHTVKGLLLRMLPRTSGNRVNGTPYRFPALGGRGTLVCGCSGICA